MDRLLQYWGYIRWVWNDYATYRPNGFRDGTRI
jgi:hypothetical protein